MSMCGSACEITHTGNDNKLCCVPTVYRYFLLDIHVDCLSHTMSSHQAAITMTKAQYHNCSPYHNYFKIKSRFIASRCGYTAIAL